MNRGTPIYASDLADSKRTEGFLGKALIEKIIEAELEGEELVIGYFTDKPKRG